MGLILEDDPRFTDAIISQRIKARCRSTINLQSAIIGYLRSPSISKGERVFNSEGRVISKLQQAIDEGLTAYYLKHRINLDSEGLLYPDLVFSDNSFIVLPKDRPAVAIYGSRISINPEVEVLSRGAFAGYGNEAQDGSEDRMAATVAFDGDIPASPEPFGGSEGVRQKAHLQSTLVTEAVRNVIGSRAITSGESFIIPRLGIDNPDLLPEFGGPDLADDSIYIQDETTNSPYNFNLKKDFNVRSIGVEELELPSLRGITEFGLPGSVGLALFNFTILTGG